MLHLRPGGTPSSISPRIRPVQKMKVFRETAGREAQRAGEPAVRESFLEKDALLEWGDRWSDGGLYGHGLRKEQS